MKLLFLINLTGRLFISFDVSVLWNMLNWMVRKDIGFFIRAFVESTRQGKLFNFLYICIAKTDDQSLNESDNSRS